MTTRKVFILISLLGGGYSMDCLADLPNNAAQTPNADGYVVSSSTRIDFTDTLIDGKFQAPMGFFLQGRKSQSLNQMVKLRSNFRNELLRSKFTIQNLVK